MAYKKIRNDVYVADTKEDLKLIKEKDIGSVCEVIKEACDYKLMSTGEWVKQVVVSASTVGGTEIDTSAFATKEELEAAIDGIVIPSIDGLATEEFVEEAIASIEHPAVDLTGLATEKYVDDAVAAIDHPVTDLTGYATKTYVDESVAAIKVAIDSEPVMKMFDEDPSIMASNPGSKFGIALNKGDERTLPEAMLEKGVGLYNFWIHKSNPNLPTEAFAKNSSCRGLCCVDTVKETGWYGWALLIDQDGDSYIQYIRNSAPQGWKALAIKTDLAKNHLERYEFDALPEGTLVNRRDKEIRIMCPTDATYSDQNVGAGGNPNMYYMTFTVYAPEGAVTFREGDKGTLTEEVLNFETTAGTGVDEFGRKYKKHWLALASKNDAGEWTYFGTNSNTTKYIGWSWITEWYDADGKVIDNDIIRINLSNADCHLALAPYYG